MCHEPGEMSSTVVTPAMSSMEVSVPAGCGISESGPVTANVPSSIVSHSVIVVVGGVVRTLMPTSAGPYVAPV